MEVSMKHKNSYIVDLVIGLIIAVLVFIYKGLFNTKETAEIMKILSDGFFTAGAALSGVGLLTAVSNQGFFSIFNYGLRSLSSMFSFNPEKKKLKLSYIEYRFERESNQKTYWHVLLIGIFYIALAVIFTLLFYNHYTERI